MCTHHTASPLAEGLDELGHGAIPRVQLVLAQLIHLQGRGRRHRGPQGGVGWGGVGWGGRESTRSAVLVTERCLLGCSVRRITHSVDSMPQPAQH
jgi:hypothetical protein